LISGILPVDKPVGWTSHDVVGRLRRVAAQKAVGHAGTLDPLATGLLVVLLGSATRLSSYLMDTSKTYRAEVVLGGTTATDDAEAPPENPMDVQGISRRHIELSMARFVGDIEQIPPMYAAIRHKGEKLYELARRGETVERVPRQVQIERIRLDCWEPPIATIEVICGSGTYIRSLARDIGGDLGVCGYLRSLCRTPSGTFGPEDAVSLETLRDLAQVTAAVFPLDRAVQHLPAVALDAAAAASRPCHSASRAARRCAPSCSLPRAVTSSVP